MNWDWDKLQEKRQRQAGQQRREERNDDHEPGNGGGGRRPGDNNNNNRGGGRGPGIPNLGNVGDAFKNLKRPRIPGLKIIIVVAVLGWFATGIFIVDPEEQGVVLRFGKMNRIVEPGPHYHLPYPIEEALTPQVHHVQRVEVGFRSRQGVVKPVQAESAMLTRDENIVNVQFIVQYQIKKAEDFLFKVDLQISDYTGKDIYSESVKNAAEAAMRDVIGGSLIDSALTDGKTQIQNDAKDLLQQMLDSYDAGISILAVQLQDVHPPQEVSEAFKDVASAREDKSRTINQAEAYRNEILPETRGNAEGMVNVALAYKETAILKAQGDAQRFLTILAEYRKGSEVTKKRLYLETMEELLSSPGIDKIIVGDGLTNGVLPFLPLDGKKPQQNSVKNAPNSSAGGSAISGNAGGVR